MILTLLALASLLILQGGVAAGDAMDNTIGGRYHYNHGYQDHNDHYATLDHDDDDDFTWDDDDDSTTGLTDELTSGVAGVDGFRSVGLDTRNSTEILNGEANISEAQVTQPTVNKAIQLDTNLIGGMASTLVNGGGSSASRNITSVDESVGEVVSHSDIETEIVDENEPNGDRGEIEGNIIDLGGKLETAGDLEERKDTTGDLGEREDTTGDLGEREDTTGDLGEREDTTGDLGEREDTSGDLGEREDTTGDLGDIRTRENENTEIEIPDETKGEVGTEIISGGENETGNEHGEADNIDSSEIDGIDGDIEDNHVGLADLDITIIDLSDTDTSITHPSNITRDTLRETPDNTDQGGRETSAHLEVIPDLIIETEEAIGSSEEHTEAEGSVEGVEEAMGKQIPSVAVTGEGLSTDASHSPISIVTKRASLLKLTTPGTTLLHRTLATINIPKFTTKASGDMHGSMEDDEFFPTRPSPKPVFIVPETTTSYMFPASLDSEEMSWNDVPAAVSPAAAYPHVWGVSVPSQDSDIRRESFSSIDGGNVLTVNPTNTIQRSEAESELYMDQGFTPVSHAASKSSIEDASEARELQMWGNVLRSTKKPIGQKNKIKFNRIGMTPKPKTRVPERASTWTWFHLFLTGSCDQVDFSNLEGLIADFRTSFSSLMLYDADGILVESINCIRCQLNVNMSVDADVYPQSEKDLQTLLSHRNIRIKLHNTSFYIESYETKRTHMFETKEEVKQMQPDILLFTLGAVGISMLCLMLYGVVFAVYQCCRPTTPYSANAKYLSDSERPKFERRQALAKPPEKRQHSVNMYRSYSNLSAPDLYSHLDSLDSGKTGRTGMTEVPRKYMNIVNKDNKKGNKKDKKKKKNKNDNEDSGLSDIADYEEMWPESLKVTNEEFMSSRSMNTSTFRTDLKDSDRDTLDPLLGYVRRVPTLDRPPNPSPPRISHQEALRNLDDAYSTPDNHSSSTYSTTYSNTTMDISRATSSIMTATMTPHSPSDVSGMTTTLSSVPLASSERKPSSTTSTSAENLCLTRITFLEVPIYQQGSHRQGPTTYSTYSIKGDMSR